MPIPSRCSRNDSLKYFLRPKRPLDYRAPRQVSQTSGIQRVELNVLSFELSDAAIVNDVNYQQKQTAETLIKFFLSNTSVEFIVNTES